MNWPGFWFGQIDLQSSSREKERLAEEVQTLQSHRRDVDASQQVEQQSSSDEDLKVGTAKSSHSLTKPAAEFHSTKCLASSSETGQLAAGKGGWEGGVWKQQEAGWPAGGGAEGAPERTGERGSVLWAGAAEESRTWGDVTK